MGLSIKISWPSPRCWSWAESHPCITKPLLLTITRLFFFHSCITQNTRKETFSHFRAQEFLKFQLGQVPAWDARIGVRSYGADPVVVRSETAAAAMIVVGGRWATVQNTVHFTAAYN